MMRVDYFLKNWTETWPSSEALFNTHPTEGCVTLWPFTLKGILRQKENYGNSNISPCKNIIFKIIL
jgi:hypothetical protein